MPLVFLLSFLAILPKVKCLQDHWLHRYFDVLLASDCAVRNAQKGRSR